MSTLRVAVDLLNEALREPFRRETAVNEFLELVRSGDVDSSFGDAGRILLELAYDLEYFEVDPEVRAEDPSYYGHARLENEIRIALGKLRPFVSGE